MKKRLLAACALSALLLNACGTAADPGVTTNPDNGSDAQAAQTELTVFAAASLTESLEEIQKNYETVDPSVKLVYNFDSSGTLKTQIEEGAVCDVFLSAGQKQMDGLGELVQADSRIDLLQNTVVLVVPKDTGNTTLDFHKLGEVGSIALGNADVPVGQYAQEILTNLNLWDTLNSAGKITFGSNVKEVTAQVAAAAVDCGVVYRTDAASEPEITVAAEAPADTYSPAVYPAAVLEQSEHAAQAQAFLDYLQTDAAMDVFKSVGFSKPA